MVYLLYSYIFINILCSWMIGGIMVFTINTEDLPQMKNCSNVNLQRYLTFTSITNFLIPIASNNIASAYGKHIYDILTDDCIFEIQSFSPYYYNAFLLNFINGSIYVVITVIISIVMALWYYYKLNSNSNSKMKPLNLIDYVSHRTETSKV